MWLILGVFCQNLLIYLCILKVINFKLGYDRVYIYTKIPRKPSLHTQMSVEVKNNKIYDFLQSRKFCESSSLWPRSRRVAGLRFRCGIGFPSRHIGLCSFCERWRVTRPLAMKWPREVSSPLWPTITTRQTKHLHCSGKQFGRHRG